LVERKSLKKITKYKSIEVIKVSNLVEIMSNHSKVAVLLAAYNGINWIEEQIDSILSQKNVLIEIFISVDYSSDKTHNWCQDLAEKNINVNVLPYGDRFGLAAKNFYRLIRDVDFSHFDYVALADQDDVWDSCKLMHAVRIIKKDNLDGYSSDVVSFWCDGREKIIRKSFPQKKFDYFFEAAGPGCTYVLKKESAQKFKKFLIKNWDVNNCIAVHDWLIYAFFRSRKLLWKIDNSPLMMYRQHESNQLGSNFGFLAYFKRIKLIRSNWYRNEVMKVFTAIGIGDEEFNLDRWFLIKNFYQLRRQSSDAFFLLLVILFGIY
jgi:rhamnosyltransferase